MLPRISDDKTAILCQFNGQEVAVSYNRKALKALGLKNWEDGANLGPVLINLDKGFEEVVKIIHLGLPGTALEQVDEWTMVWTAAHFRAFVVAFMAQWGIDFEKEVAKVKAVQASGSGEQGDPPHPSILPGPIVTQ